MAITRFRYPGEDIVRAEVIGDIWDMYGRVRYSPLFREKRMVRVRFTAPGLQNVWFEWRLVLRMVGEHAHWRRTGQPLVCGHHDRSRLHRKG